MKNREKYAEQLVDIFLSEDSMGIDKNTKQVRACKEMSCFACVFQTGKNVDCFENAKDWAEKDCEETDWTKIPVDAKVFVRNKPHGEWLERYFAFSGNGIPYVFNNGKTSISCQNANAITAWKYTRLAEDSV
jgi:hypothetical protein